MKNNTELLFNLRRNVLVYGVFLLLFWVCGMIFSLWENIYYRFGFLVLGLVLIRDSASKYINENPKDKSLIFLILALIILILSLVMLLFFR